MTIRTISELLEKGVEHHRAGRHAEADLIYREILSRDPANSEALHLGGLLAYQRGDHAAAIQLISGAIHSNPDVAAYHYNLGSVYAAGERLKDASRALERAIEIRPDYPEAYNSLGLIFDKLKMGKTARDCFEFASKVNPGFVQALVNLGDLNANEGRLAEAEECYTRALAVNSDSLIAIIGLGNLMLHQDRLTDALDCYRRSLLINPSSLDALNNLGSVMMRMGCYKEALQSFDRALELGPNHAGVHYNKAWLLLLQGEYASGWAEYSWRTKVAGRTGPTRRWLAARGAPEWNGESLAGIRLLVHSEQGFGDTIQFIRYLPLLKRQGARTVFCCQKELVRLLSDFDGIDSLLPETEDGAVAEPFDRHVALLSVPGILGTDRTNIPEGVPYLHPDADSVERWGRRLNYPGFKVGIAWAGRRTILDDYRRSCRLEDFRILRDIPGITLISLQKGEAAKSRHGFQIVNPAPDLSDFKDTAAVVMNLNLVITIDTAVAHLAGALGKEVWTLLPFFPDWRWLHSGATTQWYPTMRLYRQPAAGEWRPVFDQVARDLQARLELACN